MLNNFFKLLSGRICVGIIGLVNIIILLRVLDKESYGFYAFIIGYTTVFSVMTQFGFTSAISRIINEEKDEKVLLDILNNAFIMQLYLIIIALIVFFSILYSFYSEYKYYYNLYLWVGMVSFLLANILYEYFIRTARIYKMFTEVSVIGVLMGMARMVGFILPFLITNNCGYGFMFYGITQLLIAYYYFSKLFGKNTKYITYKLKLNYNILKTSMPFFIIAMCNVIYSQASDLLLTKYVNLEATANFDSAYKVITILRIPFITYSFLISAEVAKGFRESNNQIILKGIKSNYNFFMLALPIAALCHVFSTDIMYFFGGAKYANNHWIFSLLLIYYISVCFSDVFSLTFDYSKSFKKRTFVVLVSVVINVSLMYCMIFEYHISGMIVSLIISSFVQMILYYFIVAKEFKIYCGEYKLVSKSILLSFMFLFLCYIEYDVAKYVMAALIIILMYKTKYLTSAILN